MLTANLQRLSKLGILAATLGFAAPVQNAGKPLAAHYENQDVLVVPEDSNGLRPAALGPWVFGGRLNQDKPLDKRLNLYVVVPGKQYHSPASPEYDHTLVVNALTQDHPREWDIFWCVVLDPKLRDELKAERDLLVAAQSSFKPADLFDIEDVPARDMLAEKFGIRSLIDLRRYRHKDGTMPRLLILPARFAIRATAQAPEPAPGHNQE